MKIGDALNLVAHGCVVRRPVAKGKHLYLRLNDGVLEIGITEDVPDSVNDCLTQELCWGPAGLALTRADLLADDLEFVPETVEPPMNFPTAVTHIIAGKTVTRPDCDGSPIHYRMGAYGPLIGFKDVDGVFNWHNDPFDYNDLMAETYRIDPDPPDGPEAE